MYVGGELLARAERDAMSSRTGAILTFVFVLAVVHILMTRTVEAMQREVANSQTKVLKPVSVDPC
jgi:hypothetical protein